MPGSAAGDTAGGSPAAPGERGAGRSRFFHRTLDISGWMREEIAKLLGGRGLSIITADVSAEIMTRMSHISVINNISVKYKSADGRVFFLDNYSSASGSYDGERSAKWLIDEIKELEMRAVLRYGGGVYGSVEREAEEYQPIEQQMGVSAAERLSTSDLRIGLDLSAPVSDVVKFLTEREFVARWMLGRGSFEEAAGSASGRTFSRAAFDGNEFYGLKISRDRIELRFKRTEWAEDSTVTIGLTDAGTTTHLELVQENVPVDAVDMMGAFWRGSVFRVISMLFSCAIKDS